MRKKQPRKLARCGLAFVLACGLSVPAPALAAAAENRAGGGCFRSRF